MAVLLHDLYASWDLCHLVLSEFDRRTRSALSNRYRLRLPA